MPVNAISEVSGLQAALDAKQASGSYLTGNQSVTLSGDVTGTGATAITATLATVNSNTGSFGSSTLVPVITVDGKGRITAVSTASVSSGGSDPNVKYSAAGAALGPTIADYFTSTLSLDASSIYEIEAHGYFLKTTAGTVTWTWAFSSAPTMVTSRYEATPITGFTTTTITGAPVQAQATVEAATTLAHAVSGSLTTAVRHSFMFWVRVRTNAATTIQLRATSSAGTVTPQPGSYMRARKVV